ncbi:MAG: Glu/Leu/Phe/Val dehydrogenase [bacterium]|jgi:glutamate dehydrogenase (NAD(P)+)|nr:Glu/Leu/Phe/Val dehydrogenase [bacterium]MDD3805071.1 Glu/Leu/Phe/Val dehydrogenase [bacterium]MDD4153010.1 Glu/Leu/Phe/Val dehydrogenase [bacterium]MDD4558551.1 Glu/Leu/Phe/Val dehydrogenase [bacterium]
MSSVDFEKLRHCIKIPEAAERLLTKREKEICFNLTIVLDENTVIEGDCYVVYHNTARGPAKGGIRFSPQVTLDETRDLAERMVWKTALAGIPFGGGKSGICLDPTKLTRFQKTAVLKEFVRMIEWELRSGAYVPAPDMGTTPFDMAVIYGETRMPESITGKPPRVGGLPGRREATGHGIAFVSIMGLQEILRQVPERTTVAVQGFGNVGSYTALFLQEYGCKVQAVSDITGGFYNEKGLDVAEMFEYARLNGSLAGYDKGEAITNEDLLLLDVDVLCPCALENVIHAGNAANIKAKMIVEGANGPTTAEADLVLNENEVVIIPDILANSGGVVASYVEWRKAKSGSITEAAETYHTIDDRIGLAFNQMRECSERFKVDNRTAVQVIAVEELVCSMRERGWI